MNGESHLTLFLQCHGIITRGVVVSCENVNVLSLGGRPGVKGEIAISSHPPHKQQTNDFLIGTLLHDVYRSFDSDVDPSERNQYQLLESLVGPLRDLYRKCDVEYPRGYQIQPNPRELRTFIFDSSEHESHRCCVEEGDERCTYSRIRGIRTSCSDIVWSPEYGIFPIISSIKGDYTHTVVSIPDTDRAGKKRQSRNIPEEVIEIQPKNILDAGREFWRKKIEHNTELSVTLREKLLTEFDTLCHEKKTTIDKLINMFQLGMGYTHLYFIDPSCRNYTDKNGLPIPDDKIMTSPRGKWHRSIDETLQTLHKSKSLSLSRTPSHVPSRAHSPAPACVYTRRHRESKKQFGCVMMGGITQRRRRRRQPHRQSRSHRYSHRHSHRHSHRRRS